jgi:hypothetical protein
LAKSLYDQAVAGNVTAANWFTKTQMGWRETQNINVSEQSALANMTEEELIEAIEEQANRLGGKMNLRIE